MTATKKTKTALVVSITAIALSVITALSLLIGLGNSKVTTEKVSPSMYERGTITETGKIIDSNESLYLEEMQTVSSLKIEVDEETVNVTYKVAFYDEDEEFITLTEDKAEDFEILDVPETAKYFRVVITPNEVDGEAVKLNIFNHDKYAKQLTITYDRL